MGLRIFNSLILTLGCLLGSASALASGVDFRASIDQTEISTDESVSLKFTLKTEGSAASGTPQYDAPDFDLVNQFDSSYVESYYDNGKFGVKYSRDLTRVLRPKKVGSFSITGISVNVAGQTYTAPDITVNVTAGGVGTPPPRGYGGAGVGLRGAGKRPPSAANQVFLRAEVDKTNVFKGEQVIVSYYLYRRVRVFNIQVDKYPALNGFFREDLEMPVLGQRLPSEVTVLDGVQYERSLLTRYAAYPLKDGKLTVDQMRLRATYYGSRNAPGFGDEELDEAFQPFMNFFGQMNPMNATAASDPVTIEVEPLPESGKPANFSGGVGDFDVQSMVDRYEIKAGEAITLTLKIEGKGNVSAIEEPKPKWPAGVEVYDSKSRVKSGRGGAGEKIFEILLIPRTAGKLEIPGIELAYFDPKAKKYVSKTTLPVAVQVGEGVPGQQPPQSSQPTQPGAPQGPILSPILPPGAVSAISIPSGWLQRLPWIAALGFFGLCGWMASDRLRSKRRLQELAKEAQLRQESKSWQKLKEDARNAVSGASFKEVVDSYDRLTAAVYDSIDRVYKTGARALARTDLKEAVVSQGGLPDPSWRKLTELLDFAEMVRFASSAGAVSESTARSHLQKWVADAQAIEDAMIRSSSRIARSRAQESEA